MEEHVILWKNNKEVERCSGLRVPIPIRERI